jgi:tRNA uridine 5-carboxymethylaminomethyl modification enzyme
MLNRSKGPAVWGPRAQIDRKLYKTHMQAALKSYPNLTIQTGSVHDITFSSDHDGSSPVVSGVRLESGEILSCSQVIICTGTFLAGEIHIGKYGDFSLSFHLMLFLGLRAFPSGRMGDRESPPSGLSTTLRHAGFQLGRLKTGTPARLDKKTINFEGMERQEGEINPWPFSYTTDEVSNKVR